MWADKASDGAATFRPTTLCPTNVSPYSNLFEAEHWNIHIPDPTLVPLFVGLTVQKERLLGRHDESIVAPPCMQ
jgi:hypothetical protein